MGRAARNREANRSVTRTVARGSRPIVRFCLAFCACVVTARIVLDEPAVSRSFREPLHAWIAQACGSGLRAVGIDARVDQVDLVVPGFQATIAQDCDGLSAIAIYAAGVLAFPSSWKAKGAGWLLGIPTLILANLLRIGALVLAGMSSRSVFEAVHVYVFQVVLIACAVACFLAWTQSVAAGRLAPRTAGDEVRA